MILKPIFINLLAALIISFPFSLFAENTTTPATELIKIYSEDKPNITVNANEPIFIVKLKSNRTTGYSWFLREYNNNLITPVKHVYQRPDTKLIGASGSELWTFRVKPEAFAVPQQTTIRFIYARPWEGVDNATQVVFRLTIEGE